MVAATAEFLEPNVAFQGAFFHGDYVFAVVALEGGDDGMEVGVDDRFAWRKGGRSRPDWCR